MTNVLTWLIWAPALDAIFVLLVVCIFDALKAPCTHHHPLRIKALRDNGCTETRPGLQRFKSRRCPLGRHIAGSLSLAMDRWRQEVTEATKRCRSSFLDGIFQKVALERFVLRISHGPIESGRRAGKSSLRLLQAMLLPSPLCWTFSECLTL